MYCVTSKFYVHVNSNAMFCYMEVQWSLIENKDLAWGNGAGHRKV